MQRHTSLLPLSREHHYLLILAQVLKQDVPAYPGLPITPVAQRDYALRKFKTLLVPHMLWEERHLLPLADHYGGKLTKMTQQIRQEHQQLRYLFTQLQIVGLENLSFFLHQTGVALAGHIQFEERRFFQKMQDVLPDTAWLALKSSGQEN